MPLIRNWADIEALEPGLSPAENQLINACKRGEKCVLEDGTLPPEGEPAPEREVRADILRYLILGGCEDCKVEGWGVNLFGAYITGELDLSFQTATGITGLSDCRFHSGLMALQTRIELLNLTGSAFPSLNVQGAEIRGGVLLNGTTTKGEVRFSGAQIGGQLSCNDATFKNTDGAALIAQSLSVTDGLVWWGVTVEAGSVDLISAHVGYLADLLECWPKSGQLVMDGFTYDRISESDLSTQKRIDWVTAGAVSSGEFRPQPFTQLAKFYRETGHDASARDVLFERERLVRKYARRDRKIAGLSLFNNPIVELFRWLFGDLLTRWVVGYGHKPFRSLIWLFCLFFFAAIPAHFAWEEGSFAPNSGPVLVSADWLAATKSNPDNPADHWTKKSEGGQDWETFNRYAYAADLVIPIIDFGQTDAWAPSTTRGPWGWHLWWARWVFTALGWLITALGAAAITGLLKRE